MDQSELLNLLAGIRTLTYCITVHGNLHLKVKFCKRTSSPTEQTHPTVSRFITHKMDFV